MNEQKRLFQIITINSTIVYVFSFLFVYFIYQFITAFIASQYHLRVIFYYDQLKFLTPDNSPFWYSDSALTVFGSGPLISIFFAFVFIMMYHRLSKDESLVKLFFLWGALHFINRLIGSFVIGTIFFLYGSNLIADWLYLGMEIKILLVTIAIIVQIVIGSYSVFPILVSANSFKLLKPEYRGQFVKHQVFYPWLFGSIILIILYLPKFPLHETLINITMLIMLIPVYFKYNNIMLPSIDDELPVYRLSWRFIVFLLVFLSFFRIIFGKGIQFGTESENEKGIVEVMIIVGIIIAGLIYQLIKSYKKRKKRRLEMLAEIQKAIDEQSV
jgi:hypothetical protein